MTDDEIGALALALYSHPDIQDLDLLDACWYIDETSTYRPPMARSEMAAVRTAVLVAQAAKVSAQIAEMLRRFAEALRPVMQQITRAFAQIREVFVEAGMVPDTPPSDPKARALHLVRNRNTGPQVHADPRRNRR